MIVVEFDLLTPYMKADNQRQLEVELWEFLASLQHLHVYAEMAELAAPPFLWYEKYFPLLINYLQNILHAFYLFNLAALIVQKFLL